jgi:multidrug efflux pump subunit AcrA (membrane-fusion protein)
LTARRALIVVAVLVVAAAAAVGMTAVGGGVPSVTTVDVTHGEFVDYIQIRGDIRPAKSIVLSAPLQSGGDLQITKLVKNGATVNKGDIVVEFDATSLEQRLAERQSDLKSAQGEIEQLQAQQKINLEEQKTTLLKARYDVERAKLDLGKRDLISEVEYQEAKLALADAEQRLKETQAKEVSTAAAAQADLVGKQRKRDKAKFDVERTESAIAQLRLRAPAAGVVNILTNPRTQSMFGGGAYRGRSPARLDPRSRGSDLPEGRPPDGLSPERIEVRRTDH